jgi:hypothetical protein
VSLPEQLSLFRLPPPSPSPKTRHVQIGNRIVSYTLDSGRRRLVMHVDERGLRIAAPRGLGLAAIEAFVLEHSAWVLEKLDEFTARQVRRQLAVRDGQRLPLLGGEVTVAVGRGGNRFRWFDTVLELAARPNADLDALARRALQHKAAEVFAERLGYYAGRAGCTPPPLSLSSARTRWGSCSASGIRLNWRLVHLPLELLDYVVTHELAHLKEMNHSPQFWAEVERLCPDWKTRRSELKRRGGEIPLI